MPIDGDFVVGTTVSLPQDHPPFESNIIMYVLAILYNVVSAFDHCDKWHRDGQIEWTNPVVCDTYGRATIFGHFGHDGLLLHSLGSPV